MTTTNEPTNQAVVTVPMSPKQALLSLIENVAWQLEFLTGANEDMERAIQAVSDEAEFSDADVMEEINNAVEAVQSALNIESVERAVSRLRDMVNAIDDDAAAATDDDEDGDSEDQNSPLTDS